MADLRMFPATDQANSNTHRAILLVMRYCVCRLPEADECLRIERARQLGSRRLCHTPFLQPGSSVFLTSMAMEPSGLSGCSHAHATGFTTPGRISSSAER